MLAWCRHGPSGAQVIEIEATWTPAQGTFNSFEIRY
jgi:acylphosphatase